MAKKEMTTLTTEHDAVTKTAPYQYRPTIRVNREIRLKALGLYLRPRTVALALLALAGAAWALARLFGAGR